MAANRSDIVLNGMLLKVARSTGRGRDLRGTDQPKVVTESFTDADIPLTLDTWHLGAGYSQRILSGTYAYTINGDARQPRVVMPGPFTNAVTLTSATDSARWAVDVGADTYFGGGRYAFRAVNGSATSPLAADNDLGAANIGWDAVNWSGHGLVGTDASGVAGTLWDINAVHTWTSGTANRKALAPAYYNSTNGFRLFGTTDTAGNNTIKTIPENDGTAGRLPTTDGNWGTAISVGAYGGITLNKLVNNQDHVYVSSDRGLFDFDGATGKTFNLTPDLAALGRNAENGIAAHAASGYVYYGHKHGVVRYQATGFDAGRLQDVSFGFGLPNETPIRGQVTAVCQDRGWTAQAIWNGTDTYVCWGRPIAAGEPSVGPSPMLWHGGVIKLTGSKCYLLFVSGQTDPPKLWMGDGANVRWCYLARTDNPLQDSEYRFATSYSLILPAEHWGRPTTRKNLMELECEGDNLGVGASITWKYAVDGTASAVLGTANNGPVSTLLPGSEIIGRRIAFEADAINTNTAGANIRSLTLRATERVSVRALREYDVYLSEWGQDSYGGIDSTRVLKRLEDLRLLVNAGSVTLRDEFDETLTVLVLPPVTWHEVYGDSTGAATQYPSIVATVRVKVIKRTTSASTFRFNDGTLLNSGKVWG